MNTKDLFDAEVTKCGDQGMSVEERRAAYAYFLRGWHLKRLDYRQQKQAKESDLCSWSPSVYFDDLRVAGCRGYSGSRNGEGDDYNDDMKICPYCGKTIKLKGEAA